MVNVRDLRVGNYLKRYTDIERVEEIRNNRLTVRGNLYLLHKNDFSPIPITAEWLEAFGFLRDVGHYWFKLGDTNWLRYNLSDDFWCLYSDDEGDIIFPNQQIKHIHQLQNLYHALTGKDLELKKAIPNE